MDPERELHDLPQWLRLPLIFLLALALIFIIAGGIMHDEMEAARDKTDEFSPLAEDPNPKRPW